MTSRRCCNFNIYNITFIIYEWQNEQCKGGTLCKLYPPTPPLRSPGRPVFLGNQPCVPATWLAECLLLAGDIESNPGPKPTLDVSRESGAPADQVEETPGRASLEKLGCRTTPQLTAGGVGRQQQQQCKVNNYFKYFVVSFTK